MNQGIREQLENMMTKETILAGISMDILAERRRLARIHELEGQVHNLRATVQEQQRTIEKYEHEVTPQWVHEFRLYFETIPVTVEWDSEEDEDEVMVVFKGDRYPYYKSEYERHTAGQILQEYMRHLMSIGTFPE